MPFLLQSCCRRLGVPIRRDPQGNRMMTVKRASRAFTLVELLVVIGIIAALIGILLPVLSGVQSRGRDIKCQSYLKQICQLFIMYASENKGRLPYTFFPFKDASGESNLQNPAYWAA